MIPVTAAGPVIGTKMMLRGFPSSFRRKPESRGGRGGRGGYSHQITPTNRRLNFHTLVCRHQPAWAIPVRTNHRRMSRTPIRDECLPSRSWVSVAPARPVIPATHLVICMLQMPHEWAKL